MFSHLCDIVDDDGSAYDERMQRMAKMVILDGEWCAVSVALVVINGEWCAVSVASVVIKW